jgi:hypothetical protein
MRREEVDQRTRSCSPRCATVWAAVAVRVGSVLSPQPEPGVRRAPRGRRPR